MVHYIPHLGTRYEYLAPWVAWTEAVRGPANHLTGAAESPTFDPHFWAHMSTKVKKQIEGFFLLPTNQTSKVLSSQLTMSRGRPAFRSQRRKQVGHIEIGRTGIGWKDSHMEIDSGRPSGAWANRSFPNFRDSDGRNAEPACACSSLSSHETPRVGDRHEQQFCPLVLCSCPCACIRVKCAGRAFYQACDHLVSCREINIALNRPQSFVDEVKIKLPAGTATAERPTGWIADALSRAEDRIRLLGVAGASGLIRGAGIGLHRNDR